jgi:hypothetical protein
MKELEEHLPHKQFMQGTQIIHHTNRQDHWHRGQYRTPTKCTCRNIAGRKLQSRPDGDHQEQNDPVILLTVYRSSSFMNEIN